MKTKSISFTPTSSTTYFGIDVSKDELVIAQLFSNGEYEVQTWSNDNSSISDFIATLNCPQNTFITLEATGNYSMRISNALCEANIPMALLNPKQSKGFISGVLLSTTKTDAKDACALALYGKVNQPPTYRMPDDKLLKIKQLRSLLRQLKKQLVMISNQLHALDYHPKALDIARQLLEENQAHFEAQIQLVEGKLNQLSEENFQTLYELTLSIKGIGPATAQALLVATNGCAGFENAKQLAKFIGICPTQHESGTSIRSRGSIAKTGEPQIRALLYMGARSAKRYNLACKHLYERLRHKGKCHKVAMNAVCHKLVKQFFGVISKQMPFDNEFHLKTKNT